MPNWKLKGEWLKSCNCIATCPCDMAGNPAPHSFCEGLVGMNITDGYFEDVDLTGLKWAGTVHFPGAMHEGNGQIEAYIDEQASQPQRDALLAILGGKSGGPLFEILAAVCPNFEGVHFVPIDWEFDKGRRRARMSIPGYIETETEPLRVIPTGEEQRVIVKLPNGFEYKEMEVAQTVNLKSTGAIKFDWKGTNSNLAEVEQTHAGLVA